MAVEISDGKYKPQGITQFIIAFTWEGHTYLANADTIKRDLSDGGGNPILSAVCYDEDGRRGVINLTPRWEIKNLTME